GSQDTESQHLLSGHKNMILSLDGQGNITENYHYDAYGQPITLGGQQSSTAVSGNGITKSELSESDFSLRRNAFRYSGQYRDSESGLVYSLARYYSPQL